MNGLLINEPPLQVLPSLAKAIGLNEAIILQQLHYWLRRSSHKHDGHTWIYNTYEGWQEQFPFWSVSTIRRALGNLKDKHLIMATDKYNKRAFDNTLWFTIDYPVLSSVHNEISSAQNEQTMCSEWTDDLLNMNSAIPETTTETTTLKTSLPSAKATKKPKPVAEIVPATPTPQQEMFAAVCESVGWDYETITDKDKGQVAQTVGVLIKADYTVDDIRRFITEIWFKDWRWQKNQQYPTLSQLRQDIGKIHSVVPSIAPPVRSTNNGVNAILDYKAAKERMNGR